MNSKIWALLGGISWICFIAVQVVCFAVFDYFGEEWWHYAGGPGVGALVGVPLVMMSRTKKVATHADENVCSENSKITFAKTQHIRTDRRKIQSNTNKK